jgi:hypothetical protein
VFSAATLVYSSGPGLCGFAVLPQRRLRLAATEVLEQNRRQLIARASQSEI